MIQEQWLIFLRSNFYELDYSVQKLIYDAFRNFVYRDIYILYRNHELAEDVVQETFFKVINIAPGARAIHKAWITKIARNQACDFLKKQNKYHHVSEPQVVIDIEAPFLLPTVSEQVEDKIRDEMLHEALNELLPQYRQALYLYYIEEKSYKEIAQRLGKTEQAIGQTMVRARKKCFAALQKKIGDGFK
ncbi:RNA polymerase sigma factor [Paenibacillus sp. OK003]|uniref:RNA polymerase sigma factor n=1 Tax=Paenibacillus sp. OK003 TaxID=1884380 RepID=UPI0008C2C432|nr:RNA polymerase sigma factor [Paenibacillus sp. OK003]SEK49620.1 RNA polymerase sigma-70 factor, ECF subfamily [Paenibacillus sp. OK003]